MKLTAHALAKHLNQTLAKVYLLSGDEPLLEQEALAQIKSQAQAQGFTEVIKIQIDPSFNWETLISQLAHRSLFSQKQFVIIRMSTNKIGQAGSNALQTIIQTLHDELCLCLLGPRLDSSTQKSKWVKKIEAAGVWLALWPPKPHELPAWIQARLAQHGLQTNTHGIELIALLTQGNLLACQQEIEKLALSYKAGSLNGSQIAACLSDSADYHVFSLIDAVLAGHSQLVQRILEHLQRKGEAPQLILWGITRCLRQLCELSFMQKQQQPLNACFQRLKIWPAQQGPFLQALKHHQPSFWQALLAKAAHADLQSKGAAPGCVWHSLLQLCLAINIPSLKIRDIFAC